MPRRHKQVDRVEPHAQRRPRILKDRARAGMHIRAAMSAGVSGPISETMKGRDLAALDARMPQPETNTHQVFEAAFLAREPLEKLTNGKGLDFSGVARHRRLLCPEYSPASY